MAASDKLVPAADLVKGNGAHFPNESTAYRKARNELLVKEIQKTRDLTDKPVAANIAITMRQYDGVIDVLLAAGITTVTTSAGDPAILTDATSLAARVRATAWRGRRLRSASAYPRKSGHRGALPTC